VLVAAIVAATMFQESIDVCVVQWESRHQRTGSGVRGRRSNAGAKLEDLSFLARFAKSF
jgi:hypothetical protein